MVKNVSSSSNLRGSTVLPLRPAQFSNTTQSAMPPNTTLQQASTPPTTTQSALPPPSHLTNASTPAVLTTDATAISRTPADIQAYGDTDDAIPFQLKGEWSDGKGDVEKSLPDFVTVAARVLPGQSVSASATTGIPSAKNSWAEELADSRMNSVWGPDDDTGMKMYPRVGSEVLRERGSNALAAVRDGEETAVPAQESIDKVRSYYASNVPPNLLADSAESSFLSTPNKIISYYAPGVPPKLPTETSSADKIRSNYNSNEPPFLVSKGGPTTTKTDVNNGAPDYNIVAARVVPSEGTASCPSPGVQAFLDYIRSSLHSLDDNGRPIVLDTAELVRKAQEVFSNMDVAIKVRADTQVSPWPLSSSVTTSRKIFQDQTERRFGSLVACLILKGTSTDEIVKMCLDDYEFHYLVAGEVTAASASPQNPTAKFYGLSTAEKIRSYYIRNVPPNLPAESSGLPLADRISAWSNNDEVEASKADPRLLEAILKDQDEMRESMAKLEEEKKASENIQTGGVNAGGESIESPDDGDDEEQTRIIYESATPELAHSRPLSTPSTALPPPSTDMKTYLAALQIYTAHRLEPEHGHLPCVRCIYPSRPHEIGTLDELEARTRCLTRLAELGITERNMSLEALRRRVGSTASFNKEETTGTKQIQDPRSKTRADRVEHIETDPTPVRSHQQTLFSNYRSEPETLKGQPLMYDEAFSSGIVGTHLPASANPSYPSASKNFTEQMTALTADGLLQKPISPEYPLHPVFMPGTYFGSASERVPRRVSPACEHCRTILQKCNAGRPSCIGCKERGLYCIYREPPVKRQPDYTQLYPSPYSSEPDTFTNTAGKRAAGDQTEYTRPAKLAKENTLYEQYLEEATEIRKKYQQSVGIRAPGDKLPSLYENHQQDMAEAAKKYESGRTAQLSAGPFGIDYQPAHRPTLPNFPYGAQQPYPCPSYEQFPTANVQLRDTATAPGTSLITKGLEKQELEQNMLKSPEAYTQPFCDFLTENPTVWHAVQYFAKRLDAAGFKKLSERQNWTSTLEKGGKYYTSRNGTSLIAFTVGANYNSGNGVAMIAGHVDALTARLKPVSSKTTKAGYVQLGVAPYAGALNSTWWDRDLGIGGRVLVKDSKSGKIETKLVKLGWPIARIPTLAPHFGVGMIGSNNTETEAVPIIGLDSTSSSTLEFENLTLGGVGSFTATQPPKLVRAIAGELSIQDYSSIVNWELELFDTQPAQVGGLEKEFIFAGRIDDKLCSWSAMEALLASSASPASPSTGGREDDGVVKLVGVFDDEEIGSLLRQGARGNFLPSTIERISESFASSSSANILAQTYANSFLISADVTHAVNPNFLSKYLENHAPRLNVGVVVCADGNGHLTTDSVSTALLTRIAQKSKSELQLFMIRNDSRSGGTVGPMLSSAMGVRAIDAGIPQLSMHSIRATTGALDPGLGIGLFKGFFDHFEGVDAEFE